MYIIVSMCFFLAKVSVTELNQWTSYLKYDSGTQSEYFLHSNPVTVILYCNTAILVYACSCINSPTVLPQYTQRSDLQYRMHVYIQC